jgi:hypothetical protein
MLSLGQMATASEKVLAETKRFYRALPDLLKKHRGSWVVFHNGAVKSTHNSEDAAYAAALKAFGRDAGFVVACVTEVTPAPITAGVLFGIA